MKRKLVKQGMNALTVSLPAKWVQKHGLKAGEEVEVEEKDSNLIIKQKASQDELTASFHLTKESERYVRSHIGRLYRYGYNKITISFEDSNLLKSIKNATNNLIGADIVDLEGNKCTIKIFPIEEDVITDFDKYLIKILTTLKYILDIIEEDIKKGEYKREETLNELRNNNWKIKDYIMRTAFIKNIPYEKFNILTTLLFVYEKIGTDLLGFYRMYLEGTKRNIDSKKLAPIFAKLDYFIDWFIKSISKKEPISHLQEGRFRKEMRDYHIYLFNELHYDKKIDYSFLTIVFFTVELLDSTVSYLQIYMDKYSKEVDYLA